MPVSIKYTLFLATLTSGLPGCEISQKELAVSNERLRVADAATDQRADGPDRGKKVTGDQAPINQRFRTLDDYLAHLERTEKPVDGPWYKRVSPGVYELQTGNLHLDGAGGEKRTFTRQELAEMFGFSS